MRTPKGTLVLNDVVGNIRDAAGFGGWLLHMAMIEDANALRAQLLQWAEIESLKCILVSHGSPINEGPRQVLRELADTLT